MPKKIIVSIPLVLVIVAALGVVVWTTACPCHNIPGFVLLGAAHTEPVTDWRFANDVPLCQIQINTGLGPHAINLNCMATPDGRLFLSCSVATRKYWCQQVGRDAPARLRLRGVVYSVVLNRVMDQTTLDLAWEARIRKLQIYGGDKYNPKPPADARRPDSWWSFQVQSRDRL